MPLQICFSLCSPRSVSRQHFVENDTDSPDITLRTVDVIIKCLKRHIDRRANVVIAVFLEIGIADGEPKICNLDLTICEEDVGWFKIAMYYAEAMDATITVDDLREDVNGLPLSHFLMFLDEPGQIAAVAEFGNDAGVGLERNDFVEFDDVLQVVEDLKDVDFVAKEGLVDLTLDVLHVNELESDGLALVRSGVPFESFEPRYTTLE